jgi:hypothetical protein
MEILFKGNDQLGLYKPATLAACVKLGLLVIVCTQKLAVFNCHRTLNTFVARRTVEAPDMASSALSKHNKH